MPLYTPKKSSNGGHLFWLPPVRADFDITQKLNIIYSIFFYNLCVNWVADYRQGYDSFVCCLIWSYMVPKILQMVSEKRIKQHPATDILVAKGILRQRPAATNICEIDILSFVTSILECCSSK